MDIRDLLFWIFSLELAELVCHRASLDRQISGSMCHRLGRHPHVSRRLQELFGSDGRSLLPGPRGSGHRAGFLPDYRYVLETRGTATPVSCPEMRLSIGSILTPMQVNPLGSLEIA